MAKAELGTKRLCANCSAKFYDLNKTPIHCPKCGTVYVVAPVVSRARPEPAPVVQREAPVVEEVAVPETAEVETVSLEEADAEAQGTKKPATAEPGAEGEEEAEMDETLDDDDTFIEEQEEEDADVTDIIGGDIETEEEG
ncbi:MAG: TIGR02300 family protein [Xanthobacteraceae bacterium]